jgi:protein phosphatase
MSESSVPTPPPLRTVPHRTGPLGPIPVAGTKLRGRYELSIGQPCNPPKRRFFGFDSHDVRLGPVPISVICSAGVSDTLEWPNLTWMEGALRRARCPGLPRVLDAFADDGWQYLILEELNGQPLTNAWYDPNTNISRRFGWLLQIAETLRNLHQAGVILTALEPDQVMILPAGQAVVQVRPDDLVPLPLPPHAKRAPGPWVAPELLGDAPAASPQTHLYLFGLVLYSVLNNGREPEAADLVESGLPPAFVTAQPDLHPLLMRLVGKTFVQNPDYRFPSRGMAKQDPTGFSELALTLRLCQQYVDRVRLEVSAWTTTGMLRGGNEDSFAILHQAQARQDDCGESALVLLADGMGGEEGGEIAAALALQTMREKLWPLVLNADIADDTSPRPSGQPAIDMADRIFDAIQDANRRVHDAGKTGQGPAGMGCTLEVVYVDGRRLLLAHVGDSRIYLLRQGRIEQLTRDQTFVEQLLDLGLITPEEAETHPRRSVLIQAIGGQDNVEPAVKQVDVRSGDWIIVCSDGLSNQLRPSVIEELLAHCTSAEGAARRLINHANATTSSDNVTVAVVRVTN